MREKKYSNYEINCILCNYLDKIKNKKEKIHFSHWFIIHNWLADIMIFLKSTFLSCFLFYFIFFRMFSFLLGCQVLWFFFFWIIIFYFYIKYKENASCSSRGKCTFGLDSRLYGSLGRHKIRPFHKNHGNKIMCGLL